MDNNYRIEIKTQDEIEYVDNEMLVKVTVDDLREPVPMVVLSKYIYKNGNILKRPSKEIQQMLYKRISDYLKQQGYKKIFTEEFGEM